jgi:hypothetical protein
VCTAGVLLARHGSGSRLACHCLEVGVLCQDAVEVLAVGGIEEGTVLGGREGGCAAREGGEVVRWQHVDLQAAAGRAGVVFGWSLTLAYPGACGLLFRCKTMTKEPRRRPPRYAGRNPVVALSTKGR